MVFAAAHAGDDHFDWPVTCVGRTLPRSVMKALGFSLACLARYCSPPASATLSHQSAPGDT